MARKIIIGEILNLIKGLGGNPNKFMGTKSNISFLGKGPKENLFQGQIDIEGMVKSGFPIEQVITEAEKVGGYVTAGKLNDLQLQRLKDNLLQLKQAYKPDQLANITDLGTGTKDLTQEGLGSLRGSQGVGAELAADDLGGRLSATMTRISERMKKIKGMSDEMGAIGKGKVGVNLSKYDDAALNALAEEGNRIKVQLDKPGISYEQFQKLSARKKEIDDILRAAQDVPPGGYDNFKADMAMEKQKAGTFEFIDPAAEKVSYASRFNPKNEVHVNKAKALLEDPQIKGLYTEAEVKNAFDFEGLYQSHFDKGHVDIAMLFEQAGHNIPQMRASARDALLQLTKAEEAVPFAEIDLKYITEGGGGREGDPINLMVKYFGKNATENLPKESTKESITKFTDFLMNAKDSRGRGIRDPFFERETIEFSEFASGGRAGFKYGSRAIGKGILAILNKNKKNAEYMFKASDNVSPGYAKGDMKYNAELLAEQLAEDAGAVYHDLDDLARIEFYGTAYDYLAKEMGMMLQMKKLGQVVENKQMLREWNPGKGRKPSASGGLAKILEV